jgi:hypothetical protein
MKLVSIWIQDWASSDERRLALTGWVQPQDVERPHHALASTMPQER